LKFQVPATVSKITTMADKSLRLQVDTQELSKEDKAEVFGLHECLGWFMFSEVEIVENDFKDLPEIKVDGDNKTPSQRLRDRLFRYYESTHIHTDDFDGWYIKEMGRIGQHYLDKMNP